ncbi:MAG: hypothetical protein RIQ47_646 [Bacteroidota bacterium]
MGSTYKFLTICLFTMLAYFLPNICYGQNKGRDTTVVITDKTDIDALFKQARNLGNSDNTDQARRICLKILERNPNYYEVRTYLGRTYAWDKMYDNARTELSRVLIEKENDLEATAALIDVEIWSGNYDVAADYLKLGLSSNPTSEELLLKKAKVQLRKNDKEGTAITLRRVLDINPGNKDALNMMIALDMDRLNNRFQVQYEGDFFDRDFKPQQLLQAEMGRSFKFGSLIMRGSAADRFGYQGIQYEVESYVHFTRTTYADLTVGTSTSRIFPKQNYGGEIYQKLPAGFELSGGLRYLQFTQGTTIFTSSISNYYKNYWISLRVFVTPRQRDTLTDANFIRRSSETYFLRIRRYLGDADNYLGIRTGYGESPDDRRYINQIITRLKTWQVGFELQRRAFGRFFIKGDLNYAQQELRKDQVYQRISIGIQLKTSF